ncbi:MAG: roadblock/LC7 domain-containing protein [Rhizobacter sp.]|nr:roadblock/LC7 domain-containing protein [Chlorobiales bacterium]
MNNFSEVVSLFSGLQSVEGILIVDRDGLVIASSFPDSDTAMQAAPLMSTIQTDVSRHLSQIGETANQICMILNGRLIIIQSVLDTALVVFSKKKDLNLLQTKISEASVLLERIAAHAEFLNT